MKPPNRPFVPRSLRRLALLSCLASGIPALGLTHWQGLLENSPFGQVPPKPVAEEPPPGVEFRGYVEEDGERLFAILVTPKDGRPRNAWIHLGESSGEFTLQSYDAESEAVNVSLSGKTLTLALKKASIQLSAAAPTAPAPAHADSTASSAAPQPEDPKRLQAIAEEIRRRRALRQQNANPGT
jgi:hypothetical protein